MSLLSITFSNRTLIRLLKNELFPMMFINQFLSIVLLLPLLKLIQTTISSNKLGWLTSIQPINWWLQVQPHNRHPLHNLPQTYRVIKAVCPIFIRPKYNLLTHPRKIFSTNELWCSKCNKHRTTIKKDILDQ